MFIRCTFKCHMEIVNPSLFDKRSDIKNVLKLSRMQPTQHYQKYIDLKKKIFVSCLKV